MVITEIISCKLYSLQGVTNNSVCIKAHCKGQQIQHLLTVNISLLTQWLPVEFTQAYCYFFYLLIELIIWNL